MNINFAFTGDNANIMSVVSDTSSALNELASYMKKFSGEGLDLSNAKQSIEFFQKYISGLEETIETCKNELNEYAKKQKEAALAGNTAEAQKYGDAMKTTAEIIQELAQESENAQKALETLTGKMKEGTEVAEKNSGVMTKLLGGTENYNEMMKILPGPIKNVVSGINGITKAGLKFIATPLGATVAALTLAFKALTTWLHKSEEGQQALARITGYLKGVMMALEQIVMEVGKSLYDAFNNPREALNRFWKEMQEKMINGFFGFLNLIKDVGKALYHISTFQFKKGDNDLANIGKDLAQYFTGWDSSKVKDTIKNVGRIAKAESDLNVRREKLHDNRVAWANEEEKLNLELAKQQNAMRSGSSSERQAAAAKVQDIINKKYEKRIQFAREEYEIQKAENSLTWSSQEAMDAEKNYLAEITKLEAEREKAKGASLRVENSIGQSLQKTAEKLAEIARKQKELVAGFGEELAQAEREAGALKIRAMEDGFEKEKAELDYEHEQRVEAIRANYQKQVKEIEALQRKEYKAKHNGSTEGFAYDGNSEAARAALHAAEAALNNENAAYEIDITKFDKKVLEERMENRWAYLQSYGTYKEKELAITEEYDHKIAKEQDEFAKKILGKQKEKALYELQKQYSGVFELIFADTESLTNAQLAKAIEYTREEITKAANSGDIEKLTELYKRLEEQMDTQTNRNGWGFSRILDGFRKVKDASLWQSFADDESNSAKDRGDFQREAILEQQRGIALISAGISEVASTFDKLGESMQAFGGKIGEIGEMFTAIASQSSLIIKGFTAQSLTDKISVGVSGVLGIVSMVGNQISENKRVQDEWDASVERTAQQYRLLNLQSMEYQQRNIFGVENPYQKAIDNARQYRKAMSDLAEMQADLAAGQIQTGTKKKTNWKNVGTGAALGAAAGTVIPGVGNAVGAAIGAIGGALAGLFSKKEVAVFESLNEHYKELFDPKTYKLSDELLADYDKLDDSTKNIVDNWEEIRQKALDAEKDMKETIKNLSGDVGGNLRNALVEAFRNGDLYSAIDAFHGKMSETIEDIISQMIFSELFGDLFDDLEEKMSKSFGENGDGDIVDDLIWFDDAYQDRLAAYQKAMNDAQGAMEHLGYDVFKKQEDYEEDATTGSFKGMSQQMGAALEGRFTAVQIAAQNIVERMTQNISLMSSICNYEASSNTALLEIRDAHMREVAFLEDIAKRMIPVAELSGLSDKINIISSKL